MKRILSVLLCLALVLALAGCGETVSDIAGNLLDAAKKELENQVKATLEKYKVSVVEIKTAAGHLNGEEKANQFFCAALVQSNSESVPQSCADALGKVFGEASVHPQSTSKLDSPYLVHKEITFDHTDFSAGNYYVIYVYSADISIQLPDFGK